ncbi:hypothetical protein [Luteolibacter marinus]|uniref:hypothetical protein n=1 Tax=Luteolibacter marinus TaxID=2776705 RepID=UPI001867060E|nr:hypothetical protein [Luteolibacter marinus]
MRAHPNILERCDFIQKLIAGMCARGCDDEAYALVNGCSGSVREAGMYAFFANVSDDKGRAMDLLKVVSFDDLYPAMFGYMKGFDTGDLKAEVTSSRLDGLRDARRHDLPPGLIGDAVTSALKDGLVDSGRDGAADILSFARKLMADGVIKPYQVYEMVEGDENLGAFEKWEHLKGMEADASNAGDRSVELKLRGKVMAGMIDEDGSKAMDVILGDGSSERSADVDAALRHWTRVDPEGINGWFQRKQAALDPGMRAMIATSLSATAAESGEYESAKQWAGQIQDPVARSGALERVEETILNHRKWLEEK